MVYGNIKEEELKTRIAQDFFGEFDFGKIIGNVDFCITVPKPKSNIELLFETQSLLWAEAKKGKSDTLYSFAQLILTIGKERTFDKILPPKYLGVFDAKKFAFINYSDIQEVFYITDFNWNVRPSDYTTKEFKEVLSIISKSYSDKFYEFSLESQSNELREFIRINFTIGTEGSYKLRIDKNNFIPVFSKWMQIVKPTIGVSWDLLKANGIIEGDFYLADLLSIDNVTIKEKLNVILSYKQYELGKSINELGLLNFSRVDYTDGQRAHKQFWCIYERPPREEYWDYIIERRDLIVPQDVRERKGSYFTPRIWVELSQRYITSALGENWQEEYYVWDCAAGTGNLLAGLTNKYNVYASTLDKSDVDVMKERIQNGANLLESHVFQFDFLNDNFEKLPKTLLNVLRDDEKRKKLLIYINPPYAEASNKKTLKGGLEGNRAVEKNKVNKEYAGILGQGNAELFVQFLARIYNEIPNVKIAQFSKLKHLSGPHFNDFRHFFLAELKTMFLVPADTFDNVKGQFPIGFLVWDTAVKKRFSEFHADVYNQDGIFLKKKGIFSYDKSKYINDWIKIHRANKRRTKKNNWEVELVKGHNLFLGKMPFKGNDFQNQNLIAIVNIERDYNKEAGQFYISDYNLVPASIYFAARKVVKADWMNDRDQFLEPNPNWINDDDFKSNCLIYSIFNNSIQQKYGKNHWIPYTEDQVGAPEKFESNFMSDFLMGRVKKMGNSLHSNNNNFLALPMQFTQEAQSVYNAGLALWSYYLKQPNINVNASLYDIREHFNGRDENGKMNTRSLDETFNSLNTTLRENLKLLTSAIVPKIYEYGFLKE